jgi:hypothetical protein
MYLQSLSFLLLLVAILLPTGTIAQDDARISAESIVQKAVSAHGGRAKLAGLTKVYVRARAEPRDDINCIAEIWTDLPARRKLTLHMEKKSGEKLEVVRTVDGNGGWEWADQGKPRELDESELSEARESLYRSYVRMLFPLLEQKDEFKLVFRGEAQRKQRSTYRIIVTAQNRSDLDLFIDAQSGLLTEVSGKTIAARAKDRIATAYFPEFKDVSGLKFPARAVTLVDDVQFGADELLELRCVEEFPKGTFDRP